MNDNKTIEDMNEAELREALRAAAKSEKKRFKMFMEISEYRTAIESAVRESANELNSIGHLLIKLSALMERNYLESTSRELRFALAVNEAISTTSLIESVEKLVGNIAIEVEAARRDLGTDDNPKYQSSGRERFSDVATEVLNARKVLESVKPKSDAERAEIQRAYLISIGRISG